MFELLERFLIIRAVEVRVSQPEVSAKVIVITPDGSTKLFEGFLVAA